MNLKHVSYAFFIFFILKVFSHDLGDEEPCVYNPPDNGLCPYRTGTSMPFCWSNWETNDTPNRCNVCVIQSPSIGGGSVTFRKTYFSPIIGLHIWNTLSCDAPFITGGNTFNVHCHCSGHCHIIFHAVILFKDAMGLKQCSIIGQNISKTKQLII